MDEQSAASETDPRSLAPARPATTGRRRATRTALVGVAAIVLAFFALATLLPGDPTVGRMTPARTFAGGDGYWLAASDGGVFAFGDAPFFGSLGATPLNKPIVGMAATPTGKGYWLVASDGGVFAFGDAAFLGSLGDIKLNSLIISMAVTPSGLGYWLVAVDGGVFAFGDAVFAGSLGSQVLSSPIKAIAATPTGRGYWLAAGDGAISSFGDAAFFPPLGTAVLNRPVVSMASTASGRGLWLGAGDGGVFTLGDAAFPGSLGGLRLNSPILGMAPTYTGAGMWLGAGDGGVFALGDAVFQGSMGGTRLNRPIVAMARTARISLNAEPRAVADSVTTLEDTAAVVNVLANDLELDDAPVAVSVSTAPTKGVATVNADKTITYTPTLNTNGADSFAYRITDANGDTSTATVSLTVTAFNDAPTISDITDRATDEDTPTPAIAFTIADAETAATALTVTGSSSNTALVPNANLVFGGSGAGRTLTATPTANANGTTVITVTVSDGAKTATDTVALTVTAVDDPPVAVNQTFTGLEDAAVTGTLSASDTEGQALTYSQVGPATGGSVAITPATGAFTFTPAANFNGAASFQWKASTTSPAADSNTATTAVDLTAVNDVPSFSKGADQAVLEDTGAQSISGWATGISAGPADEAGQTLTFNLTGNTTPGLFSTAPAVSSAGVLTYTLAANANGVSSVSFTLSDSGGTANGGVNTSAAQSFTITVTAVNDVPSFTKGADQTVLEDAAAQSITGWATAISAGPANEATQTVQFNRTANTNAALFSVEPAVSPGGDLTYTLAPNANGAATVSFALLDNGGTTNGGVDTSASQSLTITVTAVNDAPSFTKGVNQSVSEDAGAQSVPGWATALSAGPADESGQTLSFVASNDNGGLFAAAPAVAPDGTLSYTPAANAFGTANVLVAIQDNGGTANGGANTSANQSFTITVGSVNDVPSFTKGNDQAVVEDSAAQSITGWATAISAGPTNESSQAVQFNRTGNTNAALFSVEPAVTPAGTLTYTLAPNANGSSTVSFAIKDDGGTANGGVDTSAAQTFTITVTAVNDAPSFTKGADQTVLEDATGAQTVTGWATAISAGPADESGQTVQFNRTANTNAGLFSVEPAVSPAGELTYTLAANANGTSTVSFAAQDNGGTANGGANTSAAQSFTITVTAVNDTPSFIKGADQTVLEDSGPTTVNGWATAISKGPANESGQTVLFNLTGNTTPGLFSTAPAVSPAGNLTYTLAPDANGASTVTFAVQDNGGVLNGGVDTSAGQSLTITVTAVNDSPSFTKGANQAVLEDSGPHTVSGWATAITAGPADESGQALTFNRTGDTDSTLFSVQPAVSSSTGDLTYTLAPNANGVSTVTFTLSDNGGIANGGANTSAGQSFTISVTAVNDAPSFTKGADETVLQDTGAHTVANWVQTFSAGPSDESGQAVSYPVTNVTSPSLFTVAPAVANNGTLTYTLAAGQSGTSTVTLHAHDNGGTANGGVDDGPDQTFTITVNSPNAAPSASATSASGAEDGGAITVTLTGTDTDGNPTTFAVGTGTNGTVGTPTAPSCSGATPNVCTSTVSFTPALDHFGPASFTYSVNDGTATSTPATASITVTEVNDAPVASADTLLPVAEDSSQRTIPFTDITGNDSRGPANESGQALTIIGVSNPVGGAVSISGTNVLFTPTADFNGTASFGYSLQDNGTTNAVNDFKTAAALGTASFTITEVNDAPIAVDDGLSAVAEDSGPRTMAFATLTGNDTRGAANEAGQALTVTAVTNPVGGTVSISGTDVLFTPTANFNGAASFDYTVRDNGTTNAVDDFKTDTGAVTFTTTEVNDVPVAMADSLSSVAEDSGQQIIAFSALTGNDSKGPANESGQTLTILGVSNPVGGTVSISGTNVLFTPTADFTGGASFNYTLQDNGTTNSVNDFKTAAAPGTASFTITAVNDAPVPTNDSVSSVAEDSGQRTIAFTDLTGNDSPGPNESGQTLTITAVDSPIGGTVSISGSTVLFTPAADFNGAASFDYTARDNGTTDGADDFKTALGSASFTVTSVNDAPVNVVPGAQTVNEDTNLTFGGNLSVNDVDVAGGSIKVRLDVTNGGTLTLSGTTGLTFDNGTGNGASSVHITGTQSAINTALNGLVYKGASNFNGAAVLSVIADDQGNTGAGGALTDSDTVDITVTPVNDAPIGVADAFDAAGNTRLVMGFTQSAGPDFEVAGNILDNDTDIDTPVDPGHAGLTATAATTSSANCASCNNVVINADGTFTYDPPAGFLGADTFTYTVEDNDTGDAPSPAQTGTGTVTMTVQGPVVWYVDSTPAAGQTGNRGTSHNPFTSTSSLVPSNGSVDDTGEILFVYSGTYGITGAQGGTLPLQTNQKLWGEPNGLTLDPTGSLPSTSLVAAGGTNPLLRATNATDGAGITLANGVEVRAVAANGSSTANSCTSCEAFRGTGITTATVGTNVNAQDNSGWGLVLDDGTGNITFGATVGSNSEGVARVANRDGGTVDFTGLVTGNGFGPGGAAAVHLDNNDGATVNFTGTLQVDTSGNGVDAFAAINGGTVNVTGTNNILSSAFGTTLRVDDTTIGASGLTFASVSKSGGLGGTGIFLDNTGTGNVTVNGGTINFTGGGALPLSVTNKSGGTVAIAASITSSGGVTLTSNTGTTITLSGGLNLDTTTGPGITATGGGTLNISGGTNTVDTTSGAGVVLNAVTMNLSGGGLDVTTTGGGTGVNVTGGTTSITGGGLDIVTTTGGGQGYRATSGGTVIVTGSPNTITAGTGTALNVTSTAIGAGGLGFRSISANGAANGILLNTPGSAGGLTVAGNTGTCTALNTSGCSGGTIQNTTGDAISLTSTQAVSLTRMWVKNNGGSGIIGSTVAGFTLDSSIIENNGDSAALDEAGIRFDNLTGAANITGVDVFGSIEDNARIKNTSGSLTLAINGSKFRDTDAAPNGNNGLLLQSDGGSITADIGPTSPTNFERNRTNGLQVVTNGSGSIDLDVGTGAVGSGGTFVDNNIGLNAAHNSSGPYKLFLSQASLVAGTRPNMASPINIYRAPGGATGLMTVSVTGTTIDNNDSDVGPAIQVTAEGAATQRLVLTLSNNTISEVANRGIDVLATDQARVNATVQNNLITLAHPTSSLETIELDVGTGVVGETPSICAVMTGNNTSSAAAPFSAIRVRNRSAAGQFVLPGYGGGPVDNGAVASFVSSNNTGDTASATNAGGNGFTGGACP